jgi:hydrogenase nickel incorporation protein HypA/HybF
MHEMAIADAVIEIAGRQAHGRQVAKVELSVGQMRQVAAPALRLAFEAASVGSPLEGAELELHPIAAVGICRGCGLVTPLPALPPTCVHCGGFEIEVTRGQELLVDEIELQA